MKKFISIILSIILIILIAFLICLIPIKKVLQKDNVKEIVNSIEIEEMIKEDENFKEVVDELFTPIYIEARKYNISDEYVVKLMNSDEVKSLIASITGNIIDSALTGENQKIIQNDDISNLVTKAIEKINNSNFITINDDAEEKILQIVNDKIEDYQEYIPDTQEVENALDDKTMGTLKIVRFFFDHNFVVYLSVAIIGVSFIIILLNLTKFKWFQYLGVNLMISSFCVLILSIIVKIFLRNNYAYILDILGNNYNTIITLGTLALFISIVFLIIYLVICKLTSKKKINVE